MALYLKILVWGWNQWQIIGVQQKCFYFWTKVVVLSLCDPPLGNYCCCKDYQSGKKWRHFPFRFAQCKFDRKRCRNKGFGGVHKIRWKYFAHHWPPTHHLLTFLKEFLYWNKGKSTCQIDFSVPPTSSCQHSLWMTLWMWRRKAPELTIENFKSIQNWTWEHFWLKRGYQIGNTKIDKRGDSPVFELDMWNFQQMLDLVFSETSQTLSPSKQLLFSSFPISYLVSPFKIVWAKLFKLVLTELEVIEFWVY